MPANNPSFSDLVSIFTSSVFAEPDGGPDRDLALELAKKMTPEEGQDLYHFVVLLTKLIR